MIPVVIESPYAGDVARNTRYLEAAIRDAVLHGETPYASHRMLPGALDDDDPVERALGIRAGLAWRTLVRDAGGLFVFYVDLGWSRGMMAAHGTYVAEGIQVERRRLGAPWEPDPALAQAPP